MATRVILPLLGQTMEEGTIIRWMKQEGDQVEKGEPLLEVETDKANMEVESPATGTLRKILAAEGTVVPVKELIGIIGSADEPIDDLLGSGEAAVVSSAPAEAAREPVVAAVTAGAPSAPEGRVFASPRAKKAAAERGIDIALLAGKGSGPEGRIVEKDVLAFAAQAAAPAPRATPLAARVAADLGVEVASVAGTGPAGRVRREDVLRAAVPKVERKAIGRTIPFAGMRRAVATNVSQSIRTAPHVTLVSEVDVTAVSAMREQLVPEIEKRYGVRLTFTALMVKAAALAILDHPIINSSLLEDKIAIHDDINIGVAVAIDEGLVVPVVREADMKPLHQISDEVNVLAAKARAGSLTREEMQGGTFTITNLGTYGVDVFNPIINPPESAILGVCRTVEKPVVVGGQVQVRSMMNLCLSFDHRVVDGAPAAQYLARVKEILEAPYLLLV